MKLFPLSPSLSPSLHLFPRIQAPILHSQTPPSSLPGLLHLFPTSRLLSSTPRLFPAHFQASASISTPGAFTSPSLPASRPPASFLSLSTRYLATKAFLTTSPRLLKPLNMLNMITRGSYGATEVVGVVAAGGTD